MNKNDLIARVSDVTQLSRSDATRAVEAILDVITSPNIVFILFSLGTLGLAIELYNPGAILPGIVGGICIIVALLGMQALPINYAGLALIILAIIMFLLEIKVTSYGMLTIGGIIALILGGLMLVDSPEPTLQVSMSIIITVSLCVAAFLVFAVGFVVKSHRKQVATGFEGLVGQIGKRSIGHYFYQKRRADGSTVRCTVQVFALEVERQLTSWPEQNQRHTRWFALDEAADAVNEPELRAMIQNLAALLD